MENQAIADADFDMVSLETIVLEPCPAPTKAGIYILAIISRGRKFLLQYTEKNLEGGIIGKREEKKWKREDKRGVGLKRTKIYIYFFSCSV